MLCVHCFERPPCISKIRYKCCSIVFYVTCHYHSLYFETLMCTNMQSTLLVYVITLASPEEISCNPHEQRSVIDHIILGMYG